MEFSNNNPTNMTLAEIREEAYKQGREDAIKALLNRLEPLRKFTIDGGKYAGVSLGDWFDTIAEQMKGANG